MENTSRNVEEYIREKYKFPDRVCRCLEDSLKMELDWWDIDWLIERRYYRWIQYQFSLKAKEIVKHLKTLRGGGNDWLVCVGSDDYHWMSYWCNLQSSPDRVGHFKKIEDIISDAMFEHWSLIDEEYPKDPTFYRTTWNEALDLIEVVDKTSFNENNTRSINVPHSFWEKRNLTRS
jgi:hypothetical protein